MYSKTKCKAGGYIAYSNPATKELGPLMHVSENPLRRHNHSPDDHKIDNILLSQELYAEAEKFDQKTTYCVNERKKQKTMLFWEEIMLWCRPAGNISRRIQYGKFNKRNV